jgi:transcription elongation factor GreB
MDGMSKAFTREDDRDDDDIEAPVIPAGAKNYITPAGAKRLQDELHHLKTKLRPEITATVTWAAGNGDRSENADYQYGKRKLREIDKRMRFLIKRLENIEVVDPLKIQAEHVMFGATVKIRDEEDRTRTYAIVGVDEIDLAKGRISWVSPLGLALMKARAGDVITFRAPRGVQEVEILSVEYVAID